MLNWISLTEEGQLDVIAKSKGPYMIFKHSTSCSVSKMVKRNFESDSDLLPQSIPIYYLDLIRYRSLSNRISKDFGVRHESPQLLVIENGTCEYSASHDSIDAADVASRLV